MPNSINLNVFSSQIEFSDKVYSSVVLWVIGFSREPPIPPFNAASENRVVFAYYYFHILIISTHLRILLFDVWLFFVHDVNIAVINLIARHIHCNT